MDIDGLQVALGSIQTLADEPRRKSKSRDFYWFSPLLKDQLDAVCADLVVMPADEAEVIHTLAACHARRVPVTMRGAGTGNYGQAMPLAGGVVLDLTRLNQVLHIEPGRVRAQAGARLSDIDAATQAHSGQEMRMHPSTIRGATIGGFVCGGSGGVGSITWGGLRDRSNVLGLRLVTMEATPRILELRGDAVQKAVHAYGTTGVVSEVEMALAPAYGWVDFAIGFDDFATAARFCHALGCQDALLKKLVSLVAAPIAHRYFRPLQGAVTEHQHVVLAMIAPLALESFADFVAGWPATVVYRSDAAGASALPPIYEFTWNHTTMHALRADKSITYHQIYYPAPDPVAKAVRMVERLGSDVSHHLEFVRFDGQIACYGLPLIRYTTEARLREIERAFEAESCPTFNPHTVTLEEGGMKRVDRVQLAFKRETDPLGLLNPGKMIAWDNPDYDATQNRLHLFPSAAGAIG